MAQCLLKEDHLGKIAKAYPDELTNKRKDNGNEQTKGLVYGQGLVSKITNKG